MRTNPHRLQVRLSLEELHRLRQLAQAEGLTLAGAVRRLLGGSHMQGRATEHETVALAGLVASEHVLRLLQVIVPEGARRSAELAPEAFSLAEDRLSKLAGSRIEVMT